MMSTVFRVDGTHRFFGLAQDRWAALRVEDLPRVQGWVFVNSLRGSAVYPVVAMTT